MISVIIPVYNAEIYLERMLEDVQQQTFDDFECLLVDDGSSDGSAEIIQRFCESDGRFRSFLKENGGVASARNYGIQQAKGRYIVFYDADDSVPADALQRLEESIRTEDADIAIGSMIIDSGGHQKEMKGTKALSSLKQIDRYNTKLLWNGSVCNKIFKTDLIREKELWFRPLSLGEDVIFTLEYCFASKKLTGCDALVYQYHKRYSEDKPSATAVDRTEYIDRVRIFVSEAEALVKRQIKAELAEAGGKYGFDSEEYIQRTFVCSYFLQALYKRIIRNNVIHSMYRKLWDMSESDYADMISLFETYRTKLAPPFWDDLEAAEKDLELRDGRFKSKKEILDAPEFSFIISRALRADSLDGVIRSIYSQNNPSFEVLLDGGLEGADREKYPYENCRILEGSLHADAFKKQATECSRGELVIYIDQPVEFRINTLSQINRQMESQSDYGIIGIQRLDANLKERDNKVYKMYMDRIIPDEIAAEMDFLASNKVFRRDRILERTNHFTGDAETDIRMLTDGLKGVRLPKIKIVTEFKAKDFVKRIRNEEYKNLLESLLDEMRKGTKK